MASFESTAQGEVETEGKKISKHSKRTRRPTESLNTLTLLIPKVSSLFFLALDGSVDHEVGEVDVALGFFCL